MMLVENDAALQKILQKYRLVDAQGKPVQVTIEHGNLGAGPLLSPEVINNFLSLDKSSNHKYLDWMLLQAGGGKEAQTTSAQELENVKQLFIEEQVNGYTDTHGTEHPPISAEEAEAVWERKRPEFEPEMVVADQDTLERYDWEIFGFDRNWPGHLKLYERVFKAVKQFIENVSTKEGNQSRISMINQGRQQRSTADRGKYSPVKTEITQFASLEELEEFNEEFFYFFKKRTVAKDVRAVTVYDDANVTAILPQTIAASMKHGLGNWCVANKTEFDAAFSHEKTVRKNPNWKNYSESGPFVYFKFKVPVPEGMEVLAAHLRYDACDLKNLKPDAIQFFDKANTTTPILRWSEIMSRLQSFAAKGSQDAGAAPVSGAGDLPAPGADDQATPASKRAPSRATGSKSLVKSMEAAMQAIQRFMSQEFKREMVQSNPYEAHARQIVNALLDSI
jgi:hypothetical protein